MRDWHRSLLITGMALIAWLLVIEWNKFSDDRASVNQSVTAIEDDYETEKEIKAEKADNNTTADSSSSYRLE